MSLIGTPSATPVTTFSEKHIETTVLASPAASVSFTSGLTAYKFFRLTGYIQNDANAKTVLIRFNNDSGSNYTNQRVSADSTTVAGERHATSGVNIVRGFTIAANEEASFTAIVAKPTAGVKGQLTVQTGLNASPVLVLTGSEWNNTADLISRIDVVALADNVASGTSIALFGVAA